MRVATSLWRWFDERLDLQGAYQVLAKHPVPAALGGRGGWLYVLGAATLAAFVLQVVTGIALTTAYVPSTEGAYDSLRFITDEAFLGNLVRGSHYYGASVMVVLVTLHMARVFLTGSYKFPRELNWLSGVVLLALVLALAFTGQLLRWDEDAIGSVLVAAEQAGRLPLVGEPLARLMLAGETIGATTLSRFYALHVFVLPGVMFAVIGLHLYLILRHGISEPPRAGEPVDPKSYRDRYRRHVREQGRPYFPDALWRELAAALVVVALVFGLAAAFGAKPLTAPPDPTATDVNPRPDWYLLPLFALLAVIPPALEDYVIVLLPVAAGALLIGLPLLGNRGERSPTRRPWAPAAVAVVALSGVALLFTGFETPWAPDLDTQPLTRQELGVSSGPAFEGSRIFFLSGCQYCHAVQGKGGPRGPALTHVMSRLSRDEVTARILAAPEGMPSYAGSLTPAEIEALLAFLEHVDQEGR